MGKNKEAHIGYVHVLQGNQDYFHGSTDFDKNMGLLKDKIREFFNLKNVNFLFGSGTSYGSISTMSELYENLKFESPDEDEIQKLYNEIDSQTKDREEKPNLEQYLNVMYSARTYYEGLIGKDSKGKNDVATQLSNYKRLIKKIEDYIFNSINIDFTKDEHSDTLKLYKTFYQKLALRNKDNSRLRIFTTNNDLFNETALDALSIHYIDGFSGGIHKYFNPALFNYTWSKRMDTSIDKYEPIENMVYLYKIHGSVNWQQSKTATNSFFDIEEVSVPNKPDEEPVLIYPTPIKQDKSLGTPYVDLFREFQNKLLEPHSVLFVIGYSFSDRHVNDIIYRALATNSTINVVIFGEHPNSLQYKHYNKKVDIHLEKKNRPIFFIEDNRIFTIWGTDKVLNGSEEKNSEKEVNKDGVTAKTPEDAEIKLFEDDHAKIINHFDYIVNNLIPDLEVSHNDDKLLEKFIAALKKAGENDNGDNDNGSEANNLDSKKE